MLIYARGDRKLYPTWHKTEADAVAYVVDLPVADWMIIGVGDDGPQRYPNDHPIVIRRQLSP